MYVYMYSVYTLCILCEHIASRSYAKHGTQFLHIYIFSRGTECKDKYFGLTHKVLQSINFFLSSICQRKERFISNDQSYIPSATCPCIYFWSSCYPPLPLLVKSFPRTGHMFFQWYTNSIYGGNPLIIQRPNLQHTPCIQ